MGLEQRGSRFYYYEKRRVGGRVFSRYVGGGPLAAMAAQTAATNRQEHEQHRRERRTLRDEEKQIDRQLDEQGKSIAAITGQCLRLVGFHQHKGQWRKSRAHNRKQIVSPATARASEQIHCAPQKGERNESSAG